MNEISTYVFPGLTPDAGDSLDEGGAWEFELTAIPYRGYLRRLVIDQLGDGAADGYTVELFSAAADVRAAAGSDALYAVLPGIAPLDVTGKLFHWPADVNTYYMEIPYHNDDPPNAVGARNGTLYLRINPGGGWADKTINVALTIETPG